MPILILWRETHEALMSGTGLEALMPAAAATRLGVSESRLRQLVLAGAVSPIAKVAKANLFLADDIEKLRLGRSQP